MELNANHYLFLKQNLPLLTIFQNAIYERDMPNDESVLGLTEILWQDQSDGWEVGNSFRHIQNNNFLSWEITNNLSLVFVTDTYNFLSSDQSCPFL